MYKYNEVDLTRELHNRGMSSRYGIMRIRWASDNSLAISIQDNSISPQDPRNADLVEIIKIRISNNGKNISCYAARILPEIVSGFPIDRYRH